MTDPREAITALTDSVPILLLPVRLETRFAGTELLVRVYPDDCSVSSFESELSATEVASAQRYWTGLWAAGGVEADERAVWRNLVAGHGSGRAEWITATYRPANVDDRPVKAAETDVLLAIPAPTALPADEAAALASYWQQVWRADGLVDGAAAAWDDLVGAIRPERAEALVATYRPANLANPVPGPRAGVDVRAVYVVFPPDGSVATRSRSWSRPATARLLPECFAFLGWAGNAAPVVVVGNPVPPGLVVGPDPTAPPEQQLRQEGAELVVPEPMRWLVDFERAVEVGMGIRVPLTGFERGFDQVLVLGLQAGSDPDASAAELAKLLEQHRLSRPGFGIVPQGTPTNNTDGAASGLARGDDADLSFDRLRAGDLFTDDADWSSKRDGQWLAEYLGIDSDSFRRVEHADGLDQADARAMNTALWPATAGYWMETMLAPVFDRRTVDEVRRFHTRHVSGRGAVPAIRIGTQPYGILPATAYSRMHWLRGDDGKHGDRRPFLTGLYEVLRQLHADWTALRDKVTATGTGSADPHQTLLDIVGLHASSVEFWQRYAHSDEEIHNRVVLDGVARLIHIGLFQTFGDAGLGLLRQLGYRGDARPDLLSKFFHGTANLLTGPLVDDRPLSATEPVRPYTVDGRNYLRWLADAGRTSLDTLYRQDSFDPGGPPAALLYLLLRHALQLGYHDTSVRLYESVGLLEPEGAAEAKRDGTFLHIAGRSATSESRYRLLYEARPEITGSATTPVGDFIAVALPELAPAASLREQLAALDQLTDASTGRLERAFAEHLDCCTHRLDAWLLGLVHHQLAQMRNLLPGKETVPRRGIHLGMYAWLHDVRPLRADRTPVRLPPDLTEVFRPADEPPLLRDGTNLGYLQAPSLNQAVAAAVLRNGYAGAASPDSRRTLAVNLTSDRVRRALAVLEGVRSGQSLSALLGYQFERGLHDRHGLAEVDAFIYRIRKEFPLRADRLAGTRTPPDVPIEAIEAHNVIDGLALAEHLRTAGPATTYPFGRDLPTASTAQAAAIDAEAARLLDTHDAVADLALAEGVYQAVLGNYDRVAATYETYSRGTFPPDPQVVRTPGSGTGLTHRVALHLHAGLDPAVSPVLGAPVTPRAAAEPAVNAWLAGMLPPLDRIGCAVTFRDATSGAVTTQAVRLADLSLQPVDIVRLVRDEAGQAMAELDDRIVRQALAVAPVRPDAVVRISYTDPADAQYSIFEVMPLTRCLRALTVGSRPLHAGDLTLPNRLVPPVPFVDRARVAAVRSSAKAVREDLGVWIASAAALLADPVMHRDELVTGFDRQLGELVELLARAAELGVAQAGWGFGYDAQRRVFAAVLDRCAELTERWTANRDACAELLDAFDANPAAPPTERLVLLQRAERLIAPATIAPAPADLGVYRTAVAAQRDLFGDRLDGFAAIATTSRTTVAALLDDVRALLPVSTFTAEAFTLTGHEDEMIRASQDAVTIGNVVVAELDRRLKAGKEALDGHDDAADAGVRADALITGAKALLGADFVLVPEFELSAAATDEVQSCLAATGLFDHLTDADVDFPVDTWLYGAARVRDRMRAWEELVMLAGALGVAEPELTALQLPYRPDDRWLALQLPPDADLGSERLLYTAHLAAPFDGGSRHCGLLLDEWTEAIPAETTTTGLAFHVDRPDNEAPQSMLLATPADFTGAWRWDDLVDAVTETMDLARYRAIEPAHVDTTAYTRLLPATVSAVTVNQLTISANLSLNNLTARLDTD